MSITANNAACRRCALLLLAGCLLAAPALYGGLTVELADPIPAETDGSGTAHRRAFGPIFEWRQAADGGSALAIRPFYHSVSDPLRQRAVREIVWPVASLKTLNDEDEWRVALAFGHDFDRQNASARYRVWVLPVLGWGCDAATNGYFGAFPLGGRIREFLGQDVIDFALFPLYLRLSINDHTARSILWPIFSYGASEDRSQFRVFPLYGQVVRPGHYDKRFILWPIWTWAHYEEPAASGSGFVLFPLFGHLKLTNQESWMLLPPFFRWSRSATQNESLFPWPFLQSSSGQEDKLYIWPLWGRKSIGGDSSSFLLWPIVSWHRMEAGRLRAAHFRILPVLYTAKSALCGGDHEEECVIGRQVQIWPLASYERAGSNSAVRILNLWPLRSAPVERNWAPFWTLYTHRRVADAREDDLLWGLFNYTRKTDAYRRVTLFPLLSWSRSELGAEEQVEWSVLKGLIGRRRVGERSSYRLLYLFKFGD
jgi:hypothetical protein